MNGNFIQFIFLDGVEIKSLRHGLNGFGENTMKVESPAKPPAGHRTFTRGYVGGWGNYRIGSRKGSYELDEVPEESDAEIQEKGEQFEIPTIVR